MWHYSDFFPIACGSNRTVNGPGTIHNPQSNGYYERDVACEWNIRGNGGKHLVLTFNKLDLEVSEGCQNDYVEIENVGRYCKPDQTGITIEVRSDRATVRFVTNMENEKSGFELKYNIV